MNKAEELATIRHFAESLPRASYCRQWLIDSLPAIDDAMKQDVFPDTLVLSLSEHYERAETTRKAADAYHTGRIDEARTQAEKILNDARTEARAIKASARRFLSDLAETI